LRASRPTAKRSPRQTATRSISASPPKARSASSWTAWRRSRSTKFTYEGETGTVVFGGGNGTISLGKSGCAESRQRRQVDFSYRDGSYQAEVETTKTTSGHHAHNYQEASTYSSEDYDETRSTIGFRWPTFTSPYAFDTVYPTRSGTLSGGLDDGCGCGCGCGGIYGYETWAPRGR